MELLVVTGLSGAGKSTVLTALADVDYYCVDNLPVPLLPGLLDTVHGGMEQERIAVGIDARERRYLADFPALCSRLQGDGHDVEILFLTAPDDVLLRRFSETRRKHPLGQLPEAIELERDLLAPLEGIATSTIDTARLRSRELRRVIRDRYGRVGTLHLMLMSFGFKNGIPNEADLVFDARFLDNPFDVRELRPQSGFDEPVARYVLDQADAGDLLERIESLVRFQAPRTLREGRSYMTVAIGCTGGQHRSVALVEELARRFTHGEPLTQPEARLGVSHRDVKRS